MIYVTCHGGKRVGVVIRKNPGNVSPTVQKEYVLCVLFSLKELSGFMEILFL